MPSTKFAVRVATPADAPALDALLHSSYSVLSRGSAAPDILAAALPLFGRSNPALLAAGTYYVAETAEGQFVGCGGWSREHPGSGEVTPGHGHIRHFATHPDWTRRGVAGAILRRVRSDAAAAGLRRLECQSGRMAVGFYAALGFRTVRSFELELRPGLKFPCVLMESDLTPTPSR